MREFLGMIIGSLLGALMYLFLTRSGDDGKD